MMINHVINHVQRIEELELELTVFNAKRALSPVDKQLEVISVGQSTLLMDPATPTSSYYNRIKGFGPDDLELFGQMLDIYGEQQIVPCIDMLPHLLDAEVAALLAQHGFVHSEQLAFLHLEPQGVSNISVNGELTSSPVHIVQVTEENAEEFIELIRQSNGGMELDGSIVARKKHYFHEPFFRNYIAYVRGEAAGMASLFISGSDGYLANDYTFPAFRRMGCQQALVQERIRAANRLRLNHLYTDVEFGSVSHHNMAKLKFETVYMNSFWMKT